MKHLKRLFKGVMNITLGAIIAVICYFVAFGPFVAAEKTNNMNWLWWYIPHLLAFLYLMGMSERERDNIFFKRRK